MGKVYGYLRQIDDVEMSVQREALLKLNCDSLHEEKDTSKPSDRPVFLNLINNLHQGDTLAVYELSFLFKSIPDFFNIVGLIYTKGANLLSVHEPWVDVNSSEGEVFSRLILNVSSLKNKIVFRYSKIRLARRKGGRPPKSKSDIELALKMYHSGEFSVNQICKAARISKATLYRHVEPDRR